MSRTDKDRPYFVMRNDEGVTDHDHRFSHKKITRYRYVRDDEGNIVYEDVPDYRTAEWIAEYGERTLKKTYEVEIPRWMRESMRYTTASDGFITKESHKVANPVWSDACALVAAGRGSEKMIYRMVKTPKREAYVSTEWEGCSEGAPAQRHQYYKDIPCSKEIPRDSKYYMPHWTREEGAGGKESHRREARDTLNEITKAVNSGDFDYDDDELGLTNQYRYPYSW